MSTLTLPTIEATQQFVVSDVLWDRYVQILDGLGEQSGIRTSYDGSSLELTTTSRRHEMLKQRLGRFLEAITLKLGLPLEYGGNMTFRREDLSQGLEPDQCYWIANAGRVLDKPEPDFTVDPPPDLCIEIEVSRSVVDRLGIYSALGVPEVWRCDGRVLTVLQLNDGEYEPVAESQQLNGFPAGELAAFLVDDATDRIDENTRYRRFLDWLDERE